MNTYGKLLKTATVAALLTTTAATWAAGASFVRLGGNAPAMGGAPYLGAHDSNEVLNLTVALQVQNKDALAAFLKAVQDPHSSQYRHFLTHVQTTRLYGPSQAQVRMVTEYLTSQGIKVADVTSDRLLVHASASTATLQHAFGVNIGDYAVNGQTVYAPDNNPRIRGDIAPLLTAVMGLDNVVQLQEHLHAAPTAAPAAGTVGGGVGPTGFSPQQLATHYSWPLGAGTSPLQDTTLATGVTIGIATAFTYRQSDVKEYWSAYGLPTHTVTSVAIDGVTRRINDETTLDIEHSGAMAPGAAIIVYSGLNPQFQTFVDVFDKIETDNLADVVSTSWGECEPDNPTAPIGAEDSIFLLMLAQGQTLFAAAGDGGAQDRCVTSTGAHSGPGQGGVLTISASDNADFPSSDPGVGAAAGTSLVLGSSPSESAWVDGGGADSVLFAQPSYETSTAGWVSNSKCFADTHTDTFAIDASVACAAASNASRQSSDLAMDADFNLNLFYNGRWLGGFGGTSFVAPELTGLWAIGTKALRTATSSATARIGSAPASIYGAVGAGCQEIFTDITTGNNGSGGIFNTATGWDHPTGWGVPNGGLVVGYLATGSCP